MVHPGGGGMGRSSLLSMQRTFFVFLSPAAAFAFAFAFSLSFAACFSAFLAAVAARIAAFSAWHQQRTCGSGKGPGWSRRRGGMTGGGTTAEVQKGR